jgi:hypothetical protein
MKKVLKSVIVFAIAAVLVWALPTVTAQAASDHNTSSTAKAIAVNTPVTESLGSANDISWYKFDITDVGYFQMKFGINSFSNLDDVHYGWDLYVYDSAYNEIQKIEGIQTAVTGAVRPFSQGTYYVKVKSHIDVKNYAPVGCNYDLQVAFTAAADWESEYNDQSGNADTITENAMVKGSLYTGTDVDWYKVSIKTKGYFQIVFAPDASTNLDDIHFGWKITVYDASFNEIQSDNYIEGSYTGAKRGYAKGTYYVKVEPTTTFASYAPVNCVYNLTVKTTASKVWESEGNDVSGSADTIKSGTTYSGLLQSETDADWYKIKITGSGKLTVTLKKAESTNIDDVHYGWKLYLYDSTGSGELAKTEEIKGSGKVELNNIKKGTYYVRVVAQNAYASFAPTDCEYTLTAKFTEKPSKVTLKSATAGNKQVKLSWKKVSNATGYYVYRSTSKNGTYKKVATIKKNTTVSYTDSNLKSKKTYYYKVVAYKTKDGKTTKGTASAVKSATTK